MFASYKERSPRIADDVWVDPSARLIGDIEIGARSSVWPNVSMRGDIDRIVIGEESNVQDNSVVHVESGGFPCLIGNRVTVGHSAVVHGCVLEDEVLVGIGAIILTGARIGAGSVVAAGALVPEGRQIPPNSMVMGVPAKVVREVTPEEQQRFRVNCQHYVKNGADYRAEAKQQQSHPSA
jgi:gamma-carbonic anhydrase